MASTAPVPPFSSALRAQLAKAGAEFVVENGIESAVSFGSVETEYWALKESAGLMDLSHRGRLMVEGRDAARFLHGMTTNEVKNLPVGQGNHAFFLDVHGHILSDARVFRFAEQSFLIDCDPFRAGAVRDSLERHIIADQVKLSDQRGTLACMAIEGPCAREVLRQSVGFEPPHLHPLESVEVPDEAPGSAVRLARARITNETGFWLWAAPERIAGIWDKAVQACLPLGTLPVGMGAVEICRVEAGLPRCGAEITEKTLLHETGQLRAVSFTKGCYIGQEIVERVRSRGNVHRQLMGLLFEGPQPVAAGSEIHAEGASGYELAGAITSATYSFGLRRTIALAMLRRAHAEAGTLLRVGDLSAEVSKLPFFFPTARL